MFEIRDCKELFGCKDYQYFEMWLTVTNLVQILPKSYEHDSPDPSLRGQPIGWMDCLHNDQDEQNKNEHFAAYNKETDKAKKVKMLAEAVAEGWL